MLFAEFYGEKVMTLTDGECYEATILGQEEGFYQVRFYFRLRDGFAYTEADNASHPSNEILDVVLCDCE